MKVEISKGLIPTTDYKYPCLLSTENDITIVLFYEEGKGIILHSENNDYRVNEIESGFAMQLFKPFFGSITLRQF